LDERAEIGSHDDAAAQSEDEARASIFESMELWYRRIRIHGSLGYVSPEAFEATERVGEDRHGCP